MRYVQIYKSTERVPALSVLFSLSGPAADWGKLFLPAHLLAITVGL